MEGHFTIQHIEKEMLRLNMVKHSAKFYSPDGALYARSSRIDSVMELPYFRLTCDDNLSYNVHYKKSIRESLSCMTPSQKQFYDVVRNF